MNCPRFASSLAPLRKRAQGRPGARCTRGLVCNCAQRTRTRAYRSSGEHPAFPAQWFDGVLRALPGVRIPLATVIRGSMDGALPGRAGTSSANLTPATGARTTRLGRTLQRRSSACRLFAHELLESPPCDDVCAPDAAASTAPRPAFSDDRETPLLGDGMAEVLRVIWAKREADYFRGRSFCDLRCRANQC